MKTPTFKFNATIMLSLLFCGSGVVAVAQQDPSNEALPAEAAPADGSSAEQIEAMVRDLNSDQFATRQAASRKLAEVGSAAIPAIEKAATGPELEVTTRALALLEKFASGPGKVSDESQAALKRIAAAEHSSSSPRAEKILADRAKKTDPRQAQFIPGGGIQIFGGPLNRRFQIQMRAVAGGAGKQRIKMQNVNGVKTIDVTKGGQKIHIVDDPNAGIKMEVTEKKGDKEVTKKYEAKNAEELKKNHPEAHKIYQQYSQGGAGALPGMFQRIQFGQNGIQVVPAPKLAENEAKPVDTEKKAEEKAKPE